MIGLNNKAKLIWLRNSCGTLKEVPDVFPDVPDPIVAFTPAQLRDGCEGLNTRAGIGERAGHRIACGYYVA